jgi:tryptophanyl-tRNA synthetase
VDNINTTPAKKQIVFSAIQPSGSITLGNYLGAVKNWVRMQENPDYNCIYALADLHTITVRQDPAAFRKNIIDMYASIMACGVDVDKAPFFIQSHNPDHAVMGWILDCYTQFGELSRMTQFKDKSAKHADNINAGLFTYPSLMAGDILLYQADKVPVGSDQMQHLELTRDIANRFNGIYGNVFKIPEGFIPKDGARVMSLQNPTAKMSKSDENANSYILLTDDDNVIMKKFKRAITDSEAKVRYAEGKDGINNLMSIYSAVTGLSYEEIERDFDGKGYGDFKTAVGEAVVAELSPIRKRYQEYLKDKKYIEECYTRSLEFVQRFSHRTVEKAMKKIGYVLPKR